ncbi:hypothetical protein N7488_009958 [Penicillium malachiteum]|nr:hypothetical protein N7488_009958 [Penicillium malachiteum]
MYFISYGWSFFYSPPTGSFRGAWAMQYIPCLLLMIGLPFLPRSPRWLAKVGRNEEAIRILANIQAKGDIDDPLVIAEWEEITTILTAERESPIKGWHLFFKNGMWKRTLAGISVQGWQQLSGANVMTYYIVYVFEMAGLSGNVDLISSGVEYAVFIIGTAMTFFSLTTQAVDHFLYTVPWPWVHVCLSLVASSPHTEPTCQMVSMAILAFTWRLFIIFGILSFASSVQAFFTYPETAGKTIEEIEKLFEPGATAPWKTKPGHNALDQKVEKVKKMKAAGHDIDMVYKGEADDGRAIETETVD